MREARPTDRLVKMVCPRHGARWVLRAMAGGWRCSAPVEWSEDEGAPVLCEHPGEIMGETTVAELAPPRIVVADPYLDGLSALVVDLADAGVELGARGVRLEGEGPSGQHPKAELGQRDDVALGSGPIERCSLEKMEDAEAPELGPDGLGSGRDQVAHLVERLGPSLARRGPSDAQNPHGFDVSVPRLGLATGIAREGGTGGRDGVLGIGLALAPPALAVGTVHFDDADLLALEMAGEPGPIGPGSFDTDQRDGAEVAQPPQQLLVTRLGRVEALDAKESSSII